MVSRPTPIDPHEGRGRKVTSVAGGALKEEIW
jgi:hypothetical protein